MAAVRYRRAGARLLMVVILTWISLLSAASPAAVSYSTTAPRECPDLSVDAVEVTQAIQDNANSVPLVAGKRTYARAHVQSAGADCSNVAGAFYVLRSGVWTQPLVPDNPGARITVRASPDSGYDQRQLLWSRYRPTVGRRAASTCACR